MTGKIHLPEKKMIGICFLYGILAVFSPIFPLSTHYLKLIFPFLLPLFLYRRKSIWSFLLIVITEYLFLYPIPLIMSVCGVIVTFVCRNKIELRSNRMYYECEVSAEGKKVRTMAFFDSGNRVFAKNGKPVVMADARVYNKLAGEEEEVCFGTLTGMNVAAAVDGSVTVFNGHTTSSFAVKIAKSPKKLYKCGVILHGDMVGLK